MDNHRKFQDEIKDFKRAVFEEIKEAKEDIAERAIYSIVLKSPIYSGQYIKSHRVNAGSKDPTYAPRQIKGASKIKELAESEKNNLRSNVHTTLKEKIRSVPISEDIHISNSVPHSELVENVGWLNKGPYKVYQLTALELQAIGNLKKVERKK